MKRNIFPKKTLQKTHNQRLKIIGFLKLYCHVCLILAIFLNLLVSCSIHKFSEKTNLQAESTLKDRLWIWSHGEGTMEGKYNLPSGGIISPSEAAKKMGIPNICMIRWLGKPEPPFDAYIQQFTDVKRFAWSVIDSAPETYPEKVQSALEIAKCMPNLTTLYLDDFFIGKASPDTSSLETAESPAQLNFEETRELYNKIHALERPLDLAVVVYSNQLHPAIRKHIKYCDIVSFWTWKASDLPNLNFFFEQYYSMFPGKRTLLGIYMWDFGERQPMPLELMELQCEYALQLFQEGKIEGIIFHSSPLVDTNLEAVEWAKDWIKRNSSTIRIEIQ